MIQTFEVLTNEIPADRKTPKAEVLLQLAWRRIYKVVWNRILHDQDSIRAYDDAKVLQEVAERPLDRFLAEYVMAYNRILLPSYGYKEQMLHYLTKAKCWFDDIPGKDDEVWRYFLYRELVKALLDVDLMFQPIATAQSSDMCIRCPTMPCSCDAPLEREVWAIASPVLSPADK